MFWTTFYSICKEKGTSPSAVCDAIGLSNAAASGWKKGTLPKADILVKLADYLGVSVDYLLGRDEPIAIIASEEEWDAILNNMSDESLLALRDYAKYLLWKQAQAAEDTP